MSLISNDFDEIAKKILKSGLSDYKSLERFLGVKSYFVPRLLQIVNKFPNKIYRARPESEFDYWDKTQYWHPPAEYCKVTGRANFVGAPVFYGALSAETAVKELMIQDRRIKKGDGVFISEWEIQHVQPFMMAILLYPENHFVGSQYESFENLMISKFDELANREKDFDAKAFKKQYRDLGGYFIKGDRSAYPLTAFITHSLFHNGPEDYMKAKILVYPTVSNNFNGVNFAIEKTFAENHLKLKSLSFGNFGDYQDVGFVINSGKVCVVKNEVINWNDLMTEIFYTGFKIEYDFVAEMPDADENKRGVVMSGERPFDFISYIGELVEKFGDDLIKDIPSKFAFNKVNYKIQYQAYGLNLTGYALYLSVDGKRFAINHVNAYLRYRHYKRPVNTFKSNPK